MTLSPDYIRLVLDENFKDARRLFVDPLMAMHYAHLAMLVEQGIVAREDARAIRQALDDVDVESVRSAAYDGSCEDLFFFVERLIARRSDEHAAGRLHTARSRNDIDMTLYRLRLREWLLDFGDALVDLRLRLIDLAAAHVHTIFPALTHTQPAQPSTVAHYLLAFIEELERDTVRAFAAYATTNRCPLGACAITGTGFPIDRHRTSTLLGFDAPTGNTYGSIATVDYVLEGAAAVGITLAGLGRFVQDMLLWCTVDVGFLRLPDGFVQGSSIMPQKRNPVALEHARALGSKALAQANGLPLVVHNTPFGDIVDTEDDMQPLVASMYYDACRAVRLVAVTMAGAQFDEERMARRAAGDWITITELADSLVRDHGLPFVRAHAVAGRLVRDRSASPDAPLGRLLEEASRAIAGAPVRLSDEELARILSPRHFVDVRRTWGGPAPEVTTAALAECRRQLQTDRAAHDGRRAALAAAAAARRAAVDAI